MRRLLAFVLALTVAGTSAAASSMHVHAYGGHEHPEHRHGPASHRHGHDHGDDHGVQAVSVEDRHDDHAPAGSVSSARTDGTVIEACDPGEHAIRVPGAVVSLPQIHLQLAVLPSTIVAVPPMPVRLAFAPMDVRVHGPPPDTRLPARAPPLTCLA